MQMSMKKSKSIDLTSGPILKTLSELALPIMASSLLGTAYNITDMAWIGLLGSKAVAGVGVGSMYVWLSQGLVALPRMGGQVNTAQSCGRKDYKEARSYAASALQMTILFGLLFSAASIIFLDPLIGFFNLTDPEAYSSARSYMLITCGLIIFSFLNLTLTGLFTAQGDSRSPLMANFLGLVGNMLLDPLLILGIGPFPRLETAGAGSFCQDVHKTTCINLLNIFGTKLVAQECSIIFHKNRRNVEKKQEHDRCQNISGCTKTYCDPGCDHTENAPENGITDTGQRSHQRGFNCIDRARIKILLLAVFLLHGSYKTHDESGTGDGCIEVGHTSCEGSFFAFLIVFVKFVDKWHQGIAETGSSLFCRAYCRIQSEGTPERFSQHFSFICRNGFR